MSKKPVAEEIVAEYVSQWLSHHVMPPKVNVAYLTSCDLGSIWNCISFKFSEYG